MTAPVDSDREIILRAACALFERYGYKKTTIDDIAHESGVGKGSVYLRFASKEEIGLAWLASLHAGVWDASIAACDGLPPSLGLRKYLVQRVLSRFDIFDRHHRSMDEAVASLWPHVEEKRRAYHEREAAHIVTMIEKGIEVGLFRSTDALTDARSMVQATNSLLPYSVRPDYLGDRSAVADKATKLADLLVRGIEVRNV